MTYRDFEVDAANISSYLEIAKRRVERPLSATAARLLHELDLAAASAAWDKANFDRAALRFPEGMDRQKRFAEMRQAERDAFAVYRELEPWLRRVTPAALWATAKPKRVTR